MSKTERNTGTLVPVMMSREYMAAMGLEQWLKDSEQGEWYSLDEEDTWGELLAVARDLGVIDAEFVRLRGQWFAVLGHNRTTDIQGATLSYGVDGSIGFDTIHYNGGAHWTEIVEDALNQADPEAAIREMRGEGAIDEDTQHRGDTP